MRTPAQKLVRRIVVALAAASCAIGSSAVAQTTFNWAGTVGTTTQWGTPATWSNNAVPNAPGTVVNFIADFGATASAVNIEAGSNYTVGIINMTDSGGGNAGKFNFLSGAGGTLTLDNGAAKPVINFTTGGQFDNFINVILAGTNGFEKTGGGIAQISGAVNTYTGTTKITGGGLRIIRNNNLGSASAGGAIELSGGALFVRPDAGTFALDNAGSAKRSISVTAGSAGAPSRIQVEGTSSLEVSGSFTSVAGAYFRKSDLGTLIFSGPVNSVGRVEFDGGTGVISGNFTNTEGVFIVKNNGAGNSSTLNWSGTGTVATGTGAILILNDGGTAVTNSSLNVTGGTLNVGDGVNGGRFIVGGKGLGAANVSGGTLSVKANKEVSIGSFFQFGGNNGNGTLTISGSGLFQALGAGNLIVGYGQTADTAGGAFAGTGALNLNGGTLETGRTLVTGTGATGTVNFNGGTLKAAAANANWIATTNNIIGSSGVTIDTAGYAMGISQPLQGTGALTKTGAGVLALNVGNNYSGNTTVNTGTLAVNNASGSATGTGAVTVASGAVLSGNGRIGGAATINGTLSPGSR